MNRLQRIWMSEGRRTTVVLLEGRGLDIVVQPRLEVTELLNIVASHCGLKDPDKALFGLAFVDEGGRTHWLQAERRVLDHDFPRKATAPGATLSLFHQAKFFPESVTQLRHASTVELFFLQAKHFISKGYITVADSDIGRLGALLLQICFGDFSEDDVRVQVQLSHALPLPKEAFLSRPALVNSSEELVLSTYKGLLGLSKGAALLEYMSIVERCASYGMHSYAVRDKSSVPWALGVSSKGIFQFELKGPKTKPRRVFQWKQLENLYYRDKKFSIEVHDPRRIVHTLSGANLYEEALIEEPDDLTSAVGDPTTQVSVSRRAFVPSSVQVFVFFCETAAQCKTIWSISIAQHQFYLDRKSADTKKSAPPPSARTAMAQALTLLMERRGSQQLRSAALSPTLSVPSLAPSSDSGTGTEKSEEERQKEKELYRALKEKKAALEAALTAKLRELKGVCLQEGGITGELPPEVRRTLGPGEAEPKVQRRVGTTFAFSDDLLNRRHSRADAHSTLETEVELQRRIAAAAARIAADKGTNKSVRRKRQRDAAAAASKLKALEGRLAASRLSASKPDLSRQGEDMPDQSRAWPNYAGRAAASCPVTPRGSLPDLVHSALDLDDVPLPRPSRLQAKPPRGPPARHGLERLDPSQSLPTSPHKAAKPPILASGASLESHPSAGSLPIYENIGYKNSMYQSSYRKKQYPTLAPGENARRLTHLHRTHSEHSLASLPSSELDSVQPLPDFRTGGGAAVDHSVGAYNIPHQRTSWNYASVDAGLNAGDSSDSLGTTDSLASDSSGMRYGFGRNVSELARKLSTGRLACPPNGLGSAGQSGSSVGSLPPLPVNSSTASLDRRLLRPLRNKLCSVEVSGSDLLNNNGVAKRVAVPPLAVSPTNGHSRGPDALQIRTTGGETVKPYETSDVLKYSRRSPLAPSPLSTTPSPRLARPPPPPYGSSPLHLRSPVPPRLLRSPEERDEMLTWFDESGRPKQKTATIV